MQLFMYYGFLQWFQAPMGNISQREQEGDLKDGKIIMHDHSARLFACCFRAERASSPPRCRQMRINSFKMGRISLLPSYATLLIMLQTFLAIADFLSLKLSGRIFSNFTRMDALLRMGPQRAPLQRCWTSIHFSMFYTMRSKSQRELYRISFFWEAKQLKISLTITLRLASISLGTWGVNYLKRSRALEETLEFGSLICLLIMSISRTPILCWVISQGNALTVVMNLVSESRRIFHSPASHFFASSQSSLNYQGKLMIFFFFLGDWKGIYGTSTVSFYFLGLEDWMDSFLSSDMMESLLFNLSRIYVGIILKTLLLDFQPSMIEFRITLVFSLIQMAPSPMKLTRICAILSSSFSQNLLMLITVSMMQTMFCLMGKDREV